MLLMYCPNLQAEADAADDAPAVVVATLISRQAN